MEPPPGLALQSRRKVGRQVQVPLGAGKGVTLLAAAEATDDVLPGLSWLVSPYFSWHSGPKCQAID